MEAGIFPSQIYDYVIGCTYAIPSVCFGLILVHINLCLKLATIRP